MGGPFWESELNLYLTFESSFVLGKGSRLTNTAKFICGWRAFMALVLSRSPTHGKASVSNMFTLHQQEWWVCAVVAFWKKTNDAFWKIPLTLSLFSPSEWKGKGMKRNLSSLLKPYWLLNAHTDTDLWSKSSGFTSLLFSGPMAVASGLWGHGCRCTRCSNTAEWFAQSWLDCVLRLGFFGLRWEWKRLHIPWCWSLTSQIQMVCTHLKAQRSTS